MPMFKLQVYREWTERGEIEIEADSEQEAREEAETAVNSGDEGITWDGSNMDPGDEGVEGCEEI